MVTDEQRTELKELTKEVIKLQTAFNQHARTVDQNFSHIQQYTRELKTYTREELEGVKGAPGLKMKVDRLDQRWLGVVWVLGFMGSVICAIVAGMASAWLK